MKDISTKLVKIGGHTELVRVVNYEPLNVHEVLNDIEYRKSKRGSILSNTSGLNKNNSVD